MQIWTLGDTIFRYYKFCARFFKWYFIFFFSLFICDTLIIQLKYNVILLIISLIHKLRYVFSKAVGWIHLVHNCQLYTYPALVLNRIETTFRAIKIKQVSTPRFKTCQVKQLRARRTPDFSLRETYTNARACMHFPRWLPLILDRAPRRGAASGAEQRAANE